MSITDTLLFFDLVGFILSLSSMSIVAHAASLITGSLRKGMLSFLWGLFFMSTSFIWSILFDRLNVAQVPDLKTLLLVVGMILILLSTQRLFSIYKGVDLQNTKQG